jgi:hypothetical protein
MAAAFPAPLLPAPPEPAATDQSAANTKAAHQARRIQWRREGGRNCRFNIPGPHCEEPIPQLIAIRRAKSTSTWVATAGEPKLWPKCFSTAHPGARPGAHRSRPKRNSQKPPEHLYYIDGLRRCQPCPASPPLPIPTQAISIQPSQNPSQNHPLRLPSNRHSRHSPRLSCRRQPPPRAARGWAWMAKACWRPSAAP